MLGCRIKIELFFILAIYLFFFWLSDLKVHCLQTPGPVKWLTTQTAVFKKPADAFMVEYGVWPSSVSPRWCHPALTTTAAMQWARLEAIPEEKHLKGGKVTVCDGLFCSETDPLLSSLTVLLLLCRYLLIYLTCDLILFICGIMALSYWFQICIFNYVALFILMWKAMTLTAHIHTHIHIHTHTWAYFFFFGFVST